MNVLDLIDHALDDAGDAMRWTPDPVPAPTAREVRRGVFCRKVWWLGQHPHGRRRAYGRPVRWVYQQDQWWIKWMVCRNPDCLCCSDRAWDTVLATATVTTFDELRDRFGRGLVANNDEVTG